MQKLIDTFLHGGMANRTIVKCCSRGAADLEMKRMPQDFVKEITDREGDEDQRRRAVGAQHDV